jgi:hypothetical protein
VECPRTRGSELRWRTGRTLPDAAPDPPMGQVLRPFDRIRRQRHDVEYPPTDAPQVNADDVREDTTEDTRWANRKMDRPFTIPDSRHDLETAVAEHARSNLAVWPNLPTIWS